MSDYFSSFLAYVKQCLLALDQFINALTGGMSDETLSSRAFRMYVKGKYFGTACYYLINWMFFWQNNHCYSAYVSELNRRHLPREFQKD